METLIRIDWYSHDADFGLGIRCFTFSPTKKQARQIVQGFYGKLSDDAFAPNLDEEIGDLQVFMPDGIYPRHTAPQHFAARAVLVPNDSLLLTWPGEDIENGPVRYESGFAILPVSCATELWREARGFARKGRLQSVHYRKPRITPPPAPEIVSLENARRLHRPQEYPQATPQRPANPQKAASKPRPPRHE